MIIAYCFIREGGAGGANYKKITQTTKNAFGKGHFTLGCGVFFFYFRAHLSYIYRIIRLQSLESEYSNISLFICIDPDIIRNKKKFLIVTVFSRPSPPRPPPILFASSFLFVPLVGS